MMWAFDCFQGWRCSVSMQSSDTVHPLNLHYQDGYNPSTLEAKKDLGFMGSLGCIGLGQLWLCEETLYQNSKTKIQNQTSSIGVFQFYYFSNHHFIVIIVSCFFLKWLEFTCFKSQERTPHLVFWSLVDESVIFFPGLSEAVRLSPPNIVICLVDF